MSITPFNRYSESTNQDSGQPKKTYNPEEKRQPINLGRKQVFAMPEVSK